MKSRLNIHQKILISTSLLIFLLSIYDVLLHLILGILHLLFEGAEFFLDHLVELVLETGSRETEIIVFYILMTMIFSLFYRFYRLLPIWKAKISQKLLQQITETFAQWQQLSILWKMLWSSFVITAMNCWLFLM